MLERIGFIFGLPFIAAGYLWAWIVHMFQAGMLGYGLNR